MAATAEIRPGTIGNRELTPIENALTREDVASRGTKLVDADGQAVDVPRELIELLKNIVEHLRSGQGVSVSALDAELTTTEAADLLNVSRPHLIKQLEAGALGYRMVGTHRRIRLLDVIAFRDRQAAEADDALAELTRQAEDFGLYR